MHLALVGSLAERISQPRYLIRYALAIVLVALALVASRIWFSKKQGPAEAAQIRIQCGLRGDLVRDTAGQTWSADRWYAGGQGLALSGQISLRPGMGDPFRHLRQGNFEYRIPLRKGPYEVRLYFGTRYDHRLHRWTPRRFAVLANGRDVLQPASLNASPADPMVRILRDIWPSKDGNLLLQFRSGRDTAYVNGIELLRIQADRQHAVRIVAGPTPHKGRQNEVWQADSFVTGGAVAMRASQVSGFDDPALFSGERWGTFVYRIPLFNKPHRLRLYFAEAWFGPDQAGGGGVGSRRFDVYKNGSPLLENFDIYKEAGGSLRAVEKTFPNITPGPDGYLTLSFVPRVNFACVNAIELVEEDR